MSVEGHSRHFDRAPVTSGHPQQADNAEAGRHVSKVPIAVVPQILDSGLVVKSLRGVRNDRNANQDGVCESKLKLGD
jgi:hypothetical protein